MCIWDINPGYLNNRSLLGEHVEIHKIFSMINKNKVEQYKIKKWKKYRWALMKRHDIIVSEMKIRGFNHYSPIFSDINIFKWPKEYLVSPRKQFDILKEKYKMKDRGRIPIPISAQNLWAHHKYSIMARDYNEYKRIGRYLSNVRPNNDSKRFYIELIELMRNVPRSKGILNAIEHMWGYISDEEVNKKIKIDSLDLSIILDEIKKIAYRKNEKYIIESTALSDLYVWI